MYGQAFSSILNYHYYINKYHFGIVCTMIHDGDRILTVHSQESGRGRGRGRGCDIPF